MALDRMNSESVIPRERAAWASRSRSCGSRRSATRAVRCRDSDRVFAVPGRVAPLLISFSSSIVCSPARYSIMKESATV
jgi:hypothetical protein